MERHLTTHSSPKPHLCNICGKGFARKDNLKEHRLSVHPGVVGGSEGNVTNPTTHEDILIRRSAATNVSVDGATGATIEPPPSPANAPMPLAAPQLLTSMRPVAS